MYITTSTISPATSIGGTWTQIKDGACLAAYTSTSGYTGSKHITVDQMPAHKHSATNKHAGNGVNNDWPYQWVAVDLMTVVYSLPNILVPREEDLIIILIHMLVESGYELLKI